MGPLLSTLRGIDEARLKVGWAKRHLHLLDDEIKKFLDRPPYCIRTEDDAEAGEYRILLSTDPITTSIVLILGDFVSCLRGSLDHLACQLTLTPEGSRNPKASFPIISTDDTKTQKSFDTQVKGIPSKVIDIIRSLQPYHAGDGTTRTKLWKLHRLWNIDKHRRIPAHSTRANLGIKYPPNIAPIGHMDDNSGIVRFPLSSKPDISVNPTVDFGIQFGDESERIIVPTTELLGIYNFVDQDVFPKFEGFFN